MTPVDPDEARRRIIEELSRGEYDQGEGFIAWLLGLLEGWLADVTSDLSGASPVQWALAIAAVVLVVLLVVLIARRTGLIRRAAPLSVSASLAGADAVSAEDLRARARAAVAGEAWDDAVVLAMRSLVRDLDERTLLDVTVGMTAQEVATGAARPFPDLRSRLHQAAVAFDTAAYSRRSTGPKQAQDAMRLAEYIAQASPDLNRMSAP